MNQPKFINLIVIIILLLSCNIQKDTNKECKIPAIDLKEKEYLQEAEKWEECLINKRLNEKSKKELYNDIKGSHIQQGIFVGIEGKVSDVYLSSKAFTKKLTNKELNQSLFSNDPALKFYSFLTIAERENQNVFEALRIVLNDTTKITTQYGCIVEKTTLSDLCIDQVTEKYFHTYKGYQPSNYQLTLEEKKELDQLIIDSNYKLKYRDHLEKK